MVTSLIIKFEQKRQYVSPFLSFKNPHLNNTRRNVDGIIDENVFDARYNLPLLKCGIHYKPRYGKWKEVIFPARDLKVS